MQTKRIIGFRKNIALVAHDHKKKDLIEWANYNKRILINHNLVATGTTGNMLEDALKIPIRKYPSGVTPGDP